MLVRDDLFRSMHAAHGTLTLANVTGLTFLVGNGTADRAVNFTGTIWG